MSVVFSGTNQGVFTSTGASKILQIREDLDWIQTFNQTKIAAAAASTGYQFYWQRGMAAGTGIEYASNAGATAVNTLWLTTGGFTLVNNTINTPGASVALTSITNATPPVVATGNTAGLVAGDTVRIFNTVGAQQLGGMDFTIGTIVANTSFTLAYMRAIVAATTGTFRRIPYDPYFYPPTRVISKIGSISLNGAQAAIVTFTVTHAYTLGQKLRFIIPTVTSVAFGMTELNGLEGTIIAINAADTDGTTNTVTVDIDVSAMTAFAWPLTANGAFTPAQVTPVGENTGQANIGGNVGTVPTTVGPVNPFLDAEINNGYLGILLAAGTNSPAGVVGDVIYWVAGKSYNGV